MNGRLSFGSGGGAQCDDIEDNVKPRSPAMLTRMFLHTLAVAAALTAAGWAWLLVGGGA